MPYKVQGLLYLEVVEIEDNLWKWTIYDRKMYCGTTFATWSNTAPSYLEACEAAYKQRQLIIDGKEPFQ